MGFLRRASSALRIGRRPFGAFRGTRRDTAVALPVSRALISWHSLYSGNGAQREIHFNPNIPYVAPAAQVLSRRANRERRWWTRGESPRTADASVKYPRRRANARVTSRPSARARVARDARENVTRAWTKHSPAAMFVRVGGESRAANVAIAILLAAYRQREN